MGDDDRSAPAPRAARTVIPQGRAPHLYSIVVGLLTIGLLLRRLSLSGLQSYGADGAQYIEHTARLRILKMWQQLGDAGAWRFLFDADAAFPPMLHLLTLPAGMLVGHSAEAATAVSLIWLVVLAAITGWIAHRLSRNEAVSAAVVVGVFLTPALHGYAARYYYDLPVVSLTWLAVALLIAGRDRWPIRCAALVTIVFSAAVLTKWAALSFGPPLLLAALVVRSRPRPLSGEAEQEGLLLNWRSRAVVLMLVAVAVASTLSFYLQMSGAENSLASMSRTAFASSGTALGAPNPSADPVTALSDVIKESGHRWDELSFEQRTFYPLRLVTSAFSPLLSVLALPLLLIWLVASRLGSPLLALPLLVYGGFLVLIMPVLDDRFLLPLLPALLLGCAFGWAEVSRPWNARIGVLAVSFGLVVFLDFHFAGEGPFNQEQLVAHPHQPDVPPTVARGLGASSSVEQRGWCRADRQLPSSRAFRLALWEQVRVLQPDYLGIPGQRELIDPWGDLEWWRYRGLLDQVSGPARGPEVIAICPPPGHAPYEPEAPDVVVASVRAGAEPVPPSCLIASQWELAGLVDDPDSSRAASFWRRSSELQHLLPLPVEDNAAPEALDEGPDPAGLKGEPPPGDVLPEDPRLP